MSNQYLTAMGIQVWKSRRVLPGAKTNIHYQKFRLLQNHQTRAQLWLEINADMARDVAKINPLLDAMLNAIHLQRVVLDPSEKMDDTNPILMMRIIPCDSISQQESSMLITYHPYDLLQQPQLKRQAWSDLQRFARYVEEHS